MPRVYRVRQCTCTFHRQVDRVCISYSARVTQTNTDEKIYGKIRRNASRYLLRDSLTKRGLSIRITPLVFVPRTNGPRPFVGVAELQ
jgi:hypothetical protein